MTKLKNVMLYAFLVGVFTISCSSDDDNETLTSSNMVTVGDYNLFTKTAGSGNHTIVFEAGLGDNYESWYQLLGLSENAQIIAYNRAGYEPSETANNDRNLAQLAEDLHQVILSKSENEKVVLVGHSLGGAIIRYYAIQHPEKVEALLFVDPSHEDFAVMSQDQENDMVEYFDNEGLLHIAREAEQFIENFQALDALPSLPDVPTIVLTSVRDREGTNRTDWINAHSSLGNDVSNFTHTITENSGHYIQVEEPQLVLDSIDALLD